MMKGANKKLKNVWVSKQHLSLYWLSLPLESLKVLPRDSGRFWNL